MELMWLVKLLEKTRKTESRKLNGDSIYLISIERMISNVRPFVLLITPDSNPQHPNLPPPLRQITIISRDTEPNIASSAAAGMLAPQSERLPKGPLLTLCLSSRNLYSNFVSNLESQTGKSTGYRPTGGFICPAFRGDSVSNFSPVESSGKAIWLDEIQVRSRLGANATYAMNSNY